MAAKLVRVFRLQRPKSGLSPAFTALRRNLNRIATGYDGSGHCRTAVHIGLCDRDGGQMLVVRRSCDVCAIRLAGALRRCGNGKTRRRRMQPPLRAAPLGSVPPDRRPASQARSPGVAKRAERLLGAQSWLVALHARPCCRSSRWSLDRSAGIAAAFGLRLAQDAFVLMALIARRKRRRNRADEHVAVADCAGRADKGKTEYRHDQGQAVPARARNFIILIMLLSCVVGNIAILVLLLSGIGLIPSSVRSETCVIHRIRRGSLFAPAPLRERSINSTRANDNYQSWRIMILK